MQRQREENFKRLLNKYRYQAYDVSDDPLELKTHLVFNEAQYMVISCSRNDHEQALNEVDKGIINEKEATIINMRKRASSQDTNPKLLEEIRDLKVSPLMEL